MTDELTDSPYKPEEALWEDLEENIPQSPSEPEIPNIPESTSKPEIPSTPTVPRCAIPMCGDSSRDLLRLGCMHYLHAGCMTNVLKSTRNPQCPMCRDGYLARICQIVENSRFGSPPETYHPTPDTYGPPDPVRRPPNTTRYGEQFDPTPRGTPISYGGRFGRQDDRDGHSAPTPSPGIGKIGMMGLEALQYLR